MCQKTVLAVEGIPVSVLCRGRWKGVNQRQLRRLCSLWWQKPEGCVPLNNSLGLQGGDSGNDAPQEGASFVQLGIVGCGAGKKKKKKKKSCLLPLLFCPPMAQTGSSYLRHQTE